MSDELRLQFGQSLQGELGAYTVFRRLGSGGTATVFEVLATEGELRGLTFAAKVFRRLSRPEWRANFHQEHDFLRSISHPAILRVFDHGNLNGDHPFVVTELLPETLSKRLHETRVVPEPPVVEIDHLTLATHILSALAFLAKQSPPIVHRDIKPTNVFYKGGSWVLGDFGLLKRADAPGDDRELVEESLRTAMPRNYRTPDLVEYLNGGHPPTSKSDVFQVALVLAEVITGTNPLRPSSVLRDTIELTPIPELSSIPKPHSPQGHPIRLLLESMLEQDPAQRPDAGTALDIWVGHLLQARRPTTPA